MAQAHPHIHHINNVLTYTFVLTFLIQVIPAHLIRKTIWNSSPSLYTNLNPGNKLQHKVTSRQDRLEKRMDLKCPWGWYQCQPNGEGGCCIVGSACKRNTTTNSVGCWWDCNTREPCGSGCCLDVHECVNGECQLINQTTAVLPDGTTNITSTPGDRGGPDRGAGSGWDSWSLVEKVALILGIVSGVVSIGSFLWCRKVRKRNGPNKSI